MKRAEQPEGSARDEWAHGFHLRCVAGRAPPSGSRGSIVMIHGMQENMGTWTRYVARYQDRYQTYALDLPWSGETTQRWAPHGSAREWLVRGLQLATPEPDVIFAHSFGALALLDHLCREGSGRLKGVVFFSPFYKKRHEDFTWRVARYHFDHFRNFIEEGVRLRALPRVMAKDILEIVTEKIMDQFSPYGWLEFMSLFLQTPDMDLSKITVPCLIIGGQSDIGALAEDCVLLRNELPDATLEVMPDCGHFPMLERPAEVSRYLDAFLERIDVPNFKSGPEQRGR